MKIIDLRLRPPFGPYLKNGMFDVQADNPFAISHFYKNFGMEMSDSMRTGSMEDLFAEMDRAGEMRGVVSIRKSVDGFDNDSLVMLLKKYPQRFLGACGAPVDDSKNAVELIKKYAVDGPCVAAFIEPGFHGVFADAPELAPVYEYCERNSVPLMISFGGFHGPTTEYCNPLRIEHVAARFPNLKMCLCHGGWPWVEAAVWLAFKSPNVWLSPDLYCLHVAGGRDYLEAANYMLRDKLIYGSAYPCVDIEGPVRYYLEHLHPEAAPKIMHDNAVRFLGLDK